jgi:hypothetical protein
MLILLGNEFFRHLFLPTHHTVPKPETHMAEYKFLHHDAFISSDPLAFLAFPLSLLEEVLNVRLLPKIY